MGKSRFLQAADGAKGTADDAAELISDSLVKTTGEAGGLRRPYKGLVPASATRALNDPAVAPLLLAATLIGWLFYLVAFPACPVVLPSFVGSPVNGSRYSFMLICSHT